jgi:hypothetical protein
MFKALLITVGLLLSASTVPSVAAAASTYTQQGAIVRIDPASDFLVFAYPMSDLAVSSATEITLDGHAASFGDLQPGYTASATFDNSYNLISLAAQTVPVSQFSGPLKIADQRHLSITIQPPDGPTRLFWLASRSTPVTLNGATVQLYQLKTGDHVDVSYRTYTALSVSASS